MNIDLLTVDEHQRSMKELEAAAQSKIEALERRLQRLEQQLFQRQGVCAQESPTKVQIVEFAGQSHMSTSDFAKVNLVKPQTVRKNYCLTGHYCGIRPEKLANGRLSWPATKVK